jgi:Kdo2-lipid IVA lauroyltransferase/acyltransferase
MIIFNYFKKFWASFISSLSPRFIAKIGILFGILFYFLDIRHKKIVRQNLQFIYPSWTQKTINRTSRHVFQNAGIAIFEILQMMFFTRENILQRVRVRGQENLYSAVKNPSGAILIAAHLGNWEMAQIFIQCLLQSDFVIVARKVRPTFLNIWLNNLRTRFGSTIIDKRGALPKLARTLRSGYLAGLVIDQGTIPSEGVEINFFGKTATATPAAAILARRFGCPVIPVFCVREKDGKLTVIVEPPLELKRTEDRRSDIEENTQIMNNALEQTIRLYPDQWFWFHKRWKRHYPELYK